MSTDTDKLIEKLSGDLKPVKPLLPAAVRAGCISAFSLAAVFGGIFAAARGMRPDLAQKLSETPFLLETGAMAAAGLSAALAACRLCVPDTKIRASVKAMLGLSVFIWLALIVSALRLGGAGYAIPGEGDCLSDLSMLMVLPLAGICFLMTRGAPVWRGFAGFAMTLAVGSFAALGMRLLCPNDDAGHLLFWHFLPVMAYALIGVALGKILLKKNISGI